MKSDWHPRGTPTWPDWKKAQAGQRFEHVRSGRRGTFVKIARNRNNGAVVDWDPVQVGAVMMPASRANVIAPAFDLRPIDG